LRKYFLLIQQQPQTFLFTAANNSGQRHDHFSTITGQSHTKRITANRWINWKIV